MSNKHAHIIELFEHSLTGLALFDAAEPYRVLANNVVYQQTWGEPFASEGLVDRPIAEFAPGAGASGMVRAFDQVVATGTARLFRDFPYDGLARGRVWLNWHVVPVIEGGKVIALAQTLTDATPEHDARVALEREILRREAVEAELAHEREFLRLIIETAPVGVSVARDPQGKPPILNRSAREMTGLEVQLGDLGRYKRFTAVHPDGTPYEVDEYPTTKALLHGTETVLEEMLYETPTGLRRWLVNSRPMHDSSGRIAAAVTAFMDIEEQRLAEERARLMNRELNHRLKNVFTVLKGLILLGFNDETDVREAARKLSGRLDALSAAHLISIDSDRLEPVDLRDMLAAVLRPHQAEARPLTLEGPSTLIVRQSVTPIGLIAHELATNTVKYGAWSREGGRLIVSWRVDEADRFELEWREAGQDATHAQRGDADGKRFGFRLLQSSARQLGGELTREWGETGLTTRLIAPAKTVVR